MNVDVSNIPWWATVLVVLIASISTYLVGHGKSEGATQRTMLTQAVERQQQLDERQTQMMDELHSDINRLKDEQLILRKELCEEKASNRILNNSMERLKEENEQLRRNNLELVIQLNELKAALLRFEEAKEEGGGALC